MVLCQPNNWMKFMMCNSIIRKLEFEKIYIKKPTDVLISFASLKKKYLKM